MSKTKKAPSQKGYIYVFSNDKHNGICKVGRTTIHPTERARQLTRHLAKSLVNQVIELKEENLKLRGK